MKHTQKLVIAAALVVAVGIAAFAADKPAPKERVLRLESKGQVVAEVHLLAPCQFLCDAKKSVLNVKDGIATYRATGNALAGTLLFHDGQEVVNINGNVELVGSLEDLGIK
jgi:hypothetical protein